MINTFQELQNNLNNTNSKQEVLNFIEELNAELEELNNEEENYLNAKVLKFLDYFKFKNSTTAEIKFMRNTGKTSLKFNPYLGV